MSDENSRTMLAVRFTPDFVPEEPTRHYNGFLKEIAPQLRARPGVWAIIATRDGPEARRSVAMAISNLRCRYRQHGFEFSARDVDIYARYTENGQAPVGPRGGAVR